jgi:hypothetical protein
MKKYNIYKEISTGEVFQILEIDFDRLNSLNELFIKFINLDNKINNKLYDSLDEFESEHELITDENIINQFRKLYLKNHFTSKIQTLNYSEAINYYKEVFNKTNKFLYLKPFLDLRYTKYSIDYTKKYNTANNKLLVSLLKKIEEKEYFCSKKQFLKLIEIIKI